MNSQTTDKSSSLAHGHESGDTTGPVPIPGSAAFQVKYLTRDIQVGVITGAMAIPLSVGICMISGYPIKVGLATVAFACLLGWINAWIRPGNFIGAPGIAAGDAAVLAIGVASFGIQNMAFDEQNLFHMQRRETGLGAIIAGMM